MQAMNVLLGGKVAEGKVREDGQFKIKVNSSSDLFSGLQERQEVLLTHYEEASDIAPDFKVTATSGDIIAAIENQSKKLYGVQFHPEADLTENGESIMRNFLFRIAGCHEDLKFTSTEDTCMEEIKREVGPVNKVLALVSGGVDSTVCAALLHKAIGPNRVVGVHIDKGFLRKNESTQVVESLSKIGLKMKVVNAQHTFYNGSTEITLKRNDINIRQNTGPLHSVSNPEEKRKIIGDMFVKVMNATIRDLNLDPKSTMVALGTTRLNLIESGSALISRRASKIKTHHNDSEMFQELRHQGRVLEPLKHLQKDDVCKLGKKLGLPSDIVQRHPFPGPGLAIRVLCANGPFMGDDFEDTNTKLGLIVNYCIAVSKRHPLLTEIQEQLTEEELKTLKEISSKFSVGATLLPIRSVGIQGDCRTYSYVAAISSDSPPSWSSLMVYAKIIPKLCFNINRVVYLFGSRLLHQLQEVTPTFLVPNVVDTLRKIDYLANATLLENDKMNCVNQMPIILVPLHFDRDPTMRLPSCHRSVVIRMFITNDFMTGIAATPGKQIPEELIMKIVDRVKSVPGISRVMYDLTSKPPGTTEWE
ncbi:GMP synthase [glutamine-hydrolyzing]-like isoform X2 [Rhopilema esculentum]